MNARNGSCSCVDRGIFKKKLSEICIGSYGVGNTSCEPSRDDIGMAISNGHFDAREFQGDLSELNDDWNRNASDESAYFYLQRQYHARRIAFFVVNGWSHPITLHQDGRNVKDGLHRLKAAVYLGKEFVDVVVCAD